MVSSNVNGKLVWLADVKVSVLVYPVTEVVRTLKMLTTSPAVRPELNVTAPAPVEPPVALEV